MTDIVAAWQIVETFDTVKLERWYDPEIPCSWGPFHWSCDLTRHEPEAFGFVDRVETATEAIRLAAEIAEGEKR